MRKLLSFVSVPVWALFLDTAVKNWVSGDYTYSPTTAFIITVVCLFFFVVACIASYEAIKNP